MSGMNRVERVEKFPTEEGAQQYKAALERDHPHEQWIDPPTVIPPPPSRPDLEWAVIYTYDPLNTTVPDVR